MNINIIYRSCDRVNAFSGGGRVRPFGTKFEIIAKCYESLAVSILHYKRREQYKDNPISLYIVDDDSSEELLDMFKEVSDKYGVKYQMIPMEGTGNAASLKTSYDYCYQNLDGFLFFIEDDYLMLESTIDECVDAYLRFKVLANNEVVIHPVDYPDRYHSKFTPISPAYIFLGKNRHWRTVANTTGTIGISKETLIKHWDKYEKLTKYGIDPQITEANTINLVYQEHPCLSPVPSLAHHYQFEDTLSPFLPLDTWDE
jgi:hypothetical protein